MKTVAFFSIKSGVGKTTLVHHLAWMYWRLGIPVVALDLDPQSNLTSAFLPETRLAELWGDGRRATVFGCIQPVLNRMGDVATPHVEMVAKEPLGPSLGLVPGDLGLSLFADRLAEAWPRCLSENRAEAEDGLRVTTAFHRIAAAAAAEIAAPLALIDVGPSLGAINRAALVASDHVVLPLAADRFSVQELRGVGHALRLWRGGWETRKHMDAGQGTELPGGAMEPMGYIVVQHAARRDRPVLAYDQWIERVSREYRTEVLGEPPRDVTPENDPHRIGAIRHYRSLAPMAQEARKPMFELTPADGAFGGHAAAVLDCREDFERLARRIAAAAGVPL